MHRLLVFLSGVAVESLYALGILTISKGRRQLACASSFLWGLAFVYGLDGSVMRHDWTAVLCWCFGLYVGTWVGMWAEARFAGTSPKGGE